ncbi:MAG TPA: hemerythrin domain-containing protein [Pseudonocardiaceae bacterium]|nr:hemerythrin domain-containing protein [Pseudonocardiaceae bacterium]
MTTVSGPLADARDMFAAHTMFRREFGLMPSLVRAVTAGDRQRATLVADHIALVSGVLDHHHSGEDEHIWPRLREHCPGDCAALVDVMEEQHHAVHDGLRQVTQAREAWRDSASSDTRDALAGAIERLLPVMNEHLALEEERVVPLIEKYLLNADYARVAQEQGADVPPDKLPTVFGMFMYEADPATIDMVVAEMPAEARPVIKNLAPQAYAAYSKELHGTDMPPRVTG